MHARTFSGHCGMVEGGEDWNRMVESGEDAAERVGIGGLKSRIRATSVVC